MDLRQYFQNIREIEAGIREPYTFVVSLETSDGGKAGIVSEVKRELAAKLIVEGRATLASSAEKEEFLESQARARTAAERAEMARQLQVTIVSDSSAGSLSPQLNNEPKAQLKK
jgi:hypothetical protein